MCRWVPFIYTVCGHDYRVTFPCLIKMGNDTLGPLPRFFRSVCGPPVRRCEESRVPGQYQFMYGFCRICRAEFEKRGLETRDADVIISYWDYKQEKDWKFPVPAYWIPTEKVWGKKPLPLNTEAADYHAWAFERSINWAPGGTPDERWEYSRVLQRLTLRWADELKPEGPLRWGPLSALEERHVDGPIFDDEHQPWGFQPRHYEGDPEPLHPNDPKNKPPYKSRWMPEFRIYTSHADVEAMQNLQKRVKRSIRQQMRQELKVAFPFSAETMPGSDEECSDDSNYQPPHPASPTSPTIDLSPGFLSKLKEKYDIRIEDDSDVSDCSLRPANLPTAASSSGHTNRVPPPPTIIHTVAAAASFKAMSSRSRPHAGARIDTSDSETDDGYSSEELPLFPTLDEIADEARVEVERETELEGKGKGKGKEVDGSIREEGPAETGGEGEDGEYGDYDDYDEDKISDEDESSDDEPYLSPSLDTIEEVPEVEGGVEGDVESGVEGEVKDCASETEEADPVPEPETEKSELVGDVEQASEDVSEEISEEAAEKKVSEEDVLKETTE